MLEMIFGIGNLVAISGWLVLILIPLSSHQVVQS